MKTKLLTLSFGALVGLTLPAMGNILFQTSFEGSETPAYALGEINGQNSWVYTPSATRLQSSFLTIKDSSTIGALSINQRHLFIDANRTASPTSSRRMDQWLQFSLPVSIDNPTTYFTFEVAVGNSGTADNSEVFFSLADTTISAFSGYFIALKTSAVPTGSGINRIEIGSGGTANTSFIEPAPAIAQETIYKITLAANRSGGQITKLDAWLNPTLVDGVPVGAADLNHTLTAPLSVMTGLQIRAQSVPTAITSMTIAVPEPSTYAAVLGLLALGLVAWRRRR